MVYSTFSLSQAYLRRPWSPAHIRWSTLSRNFSTRSWTGPATLSTPNSTRHCITRVVSPRTSRPRDTSQWAPSPTSSRTSNRTSPSRRQAPLTSTIKWCTKRERVRRTVAVQIIQYLPEVRRNSQTRRCKWVQFLNPCDNASKMRQRNDPIVFLTCLFFFPATQAVFPSFFCRRLKRCFHLMRPNVPRIRMSNFISPRKRLLSKCHFWTAVEVQWRT